MSLRWRLTLYYAVVTVGMVLLGGLVLFQVLRSTLRQTLDDSLRQAAAIAASQLAGDEARTEAPDLLVARLPGATVLLVYDAGGNLTDRYGTPLVSAPLTAGFVSVGETRVYSEPLSGGGFVQVMRSDVETGRSLSRTAELALLALPLLLLAGLAVGYGLADRALRPVDAVSRLAGRIATSGRYKERVPEVRGADEIARLTQTVNAMLGRLESAIEREKAFALAAAHELRTPLSVLHARASLSLERERTPEQYRQALRVVDETARDLNATVESLLLLARSQQAPPAQPVYLDGLALEAAEGLQTQAEARKVRVHLQLEPAPARGDPSGLRSAVSNLLGNALKYGQEGGQVWIRSGAEVGTVWVEVTDDGPGIPEADLERLRQPFQRGPGLQGGGGAGLGLALVGAIAEQHGGRLVLGRAAEGGLRARLELPVGRV